VEITGASKGIPAEATPTSTFCLSFQLYMGLQSIQRGDNHRLRHPRESGDLNASRRAGFPLSRESPVIGDSRESVERLRQSFSARHARLFIIHINESLLPVVARSRGTDPSMSRKGEEFGRHIKPFIPVDTSNSMVGARGDYPLHSFLGDIRCRGSRSNCVFEKSD
jgi:hypothetical protein